MIQHLEGSHAPFKSIGVVLRCLADACEDIFHAGCFRLAVLIILHIEVMHDLGYLFCGLVFDPEGFYQHFECAEISNMGKCCAARIENHGSRVERSDITFVNEGERSFRSTKGFFLVAQIFP